MWKTRVLMNILDNGRSWLGGLFLTRLTGVSAIHQAALRLTAGRRRQSGRLDNTPVGFVSLGGEGGGGGSMNIQGALE